MTLNDQITKPVVENAIDTACAKNFVEKLPGRLEEPVTERGSTLSAGQRQLLSFARAIAHDPAVIVFDEATANIDSKTEALIQKAIGRISSDKTILIIAHRLSTIRNADRILVLRHGRIVESGNHKRLMEKGGYYRQMIEEG